MKIHRDEEGTAYIQEEGTRVYAIEAANDEGWYLERQIDGGDPYPERLEYWSDSEEEAIAKLRTFGE